MRHAWFRAVVCFALAMPNWAAFAEEKRQRAPAPQPAAEAQKQKQQITIGPVELALLIKSAIMALQQANQTGNYSVLRDLGTPVFRERFDQAKLTAAFANLRSRNVNLSPVMILTPNLTKQPELTPENQLHLVGDFPTQPLKIQYELHCCPAISRTDSVGWRQGCQDFAELCRQATDPTVFSRKG